MLVGLYNIRIDGCTFLTLHALFFELLECSPTVVTIHHLSCSIGSSFYSLLMHLLSWIMFNTVVSVLDCFRGSTLLNCICQILGTIKYFVSMMLVLVSSKYSYHKQVKKKKNYVCGLRLSNRWIQKKKKIMVRGKVNI